MSLSFTILLAVSLLLQVEADATSEEGRLLSLVNQERASRGLSLLSLHPLLAQTAKNYSREMMEHGFFNHISEIDGSTVLDRIRRSGYYDGYRGTIVARENIAFVSGSANAASVHQGFMNSEGHRLNLLASDVNEVGIGITEGSFQSVFGSIYVEVFAYHARDQQITVSATVTPDSVTVQRGDKAIFSIHVDSSVPSSASIQVMNLPSSLAWDMDKLSGTTPLDAKMTITTASATVGTYQFSILATVAGQTRTLQCKLSILQPTIVTTTSTATVTNTSVKTTNSSTYSTQILTTASTSKTQTYYSSTSTVITQARTSSAETSRSSSSYIQTSSSTNERQSSTTSATRSSTADNTATTSTRTTISTVTIPIPRCLIATAAFGSELSAEVQFLREFRDMKVMSTQGGKLFISVFNRAYYSVSPTIAESVAQSSSVAFVVRASIYPLIVALRVAEYVFECLKSELEIAVISAGLLASSLVGLVYLLPVLLLLERTFKTRTR